MPFVEDKTSSFVPDTESFVPDEPKAGKVKSNFFKGLVEGFTGGSLNVASGLTGTLGETLKPPKKLDLSSPYSVASSQVLMKSDDLKQLSGKVNAFANELYQAGEQYAPTKGAGVGDFVGRAIGQAVPYMTASVGATLATGTPAAAFGVAFAVEGDNAYREAIRNGATEDEANTERIIVGSINGAIEQLQVGGILKFGKKIKEPAKVLIKAAKDKALKRIAKAGGKLTIETLKHAAQEGLEEAMQENVSMFVPAIHGRDVPTGEEALARTGQAALGGAVVGGILGGAGAIRGTEAAVQPTKEVEAVTPPIKEVAPQKPTEAVEELEIRPEAVEAFQGIDLSDKELMLEQLHKEDLDAGLASTPTLLRGYREFKASLTPAEAEEFSSVLGVIDHRIARDLAQPTPTAEPPQLVPEPIAAQQSHKVAQTTPVGEEVTPTVEPSVQKNMPLKAKMAPIRLVSDSKDTSALLDTFYAERNDKETATDISTRNHQANLKQLSGTKKYGVVAKGWDAAMQVYIDLQNNPDQMQYYDKLSATQKKIVDQAQNLPADVKALADQIIAENKTFGQMAVDQEVIHNAKDNYSARLWMKEPQKRGLFKKFGTTTPRAKARTLEGILHGWSIGKTLQVTGATNAQNVAHKQVTQAIVDKQVMKLGKDWGLISPKQHKDWRRVEHPNFTSWKYAGKATKGEAYGQNFFVADNGTLMERVGMYAEPTLAKKLNTVLSSSSLYNVPGVAWLTKWNSIIKQNILMTSFFHHQAYLRSYVGGAKTGIKNIGPTKAYKAGGEAIRNYLPEVQQLVRGGLTIGKVQDWDESMLQRENTVWSRVARKFKAGEKGAKAIQKLREQQTDFLFKKLGPQLKVQAALLEYRHQLKKNNAKLESGEKTQHDIAKDVAGFINADFGGMNLMRMERNQTAQHIFRLIALAPDWTESNIQTMVRAFKGGNEGAMYRAFWGRIALKLGGATVVFNYLMAAFDDDDFVERYKKAWDAGWLRWLDVDITPLYKAMGGTGKRKYFSILGHFKDPIKFIVHPIRSAKHKSSVFARMILSDLPTGEDWRGREFTSFSELIGMDDKGEYKTTRKGKYKKGDPKGGKLKGSLTKFSIGGGGPVEYGQVPSYLLYELRSAQPIQVQNALAFLAGEIDGFDAISKSLGLMTGSTREEEKKKKYKALK